MCLRLGVPGESSSRLLRRQEERPFTVLGRVQGAPGAAGSGGLLWQLPEAVLRGGVDERPHQRRRRLRGGGGHRQSDQGVGTRHTQRRRGMASEDRFFDARAAHVDRRFTEVPRLRCRLGVGKANKGGDDLDREDAGHRVPRGEQGWRRRDRDGCGAPSEGHG
ncbi:Anthocyanin 5-aromatic [Musa troglodytarum]|uniref:Anthocyanin 5-aromatic n=1 Tax=Musa troglodytarum TaxID=320322 RepID=A0A9E7ET43_9LILI|nr:Anthocyanin 5-aromatic [Musa troglodytarum]